MIDVVFVEESNESAKHILIHYKRTKELWIFLITIFGLKWVFLELVRNLLLKWSLFLVLPFGNRCILPVYFEMPFGHPFLFIHTILILPIKEKNEV